MPIGFHFYSYLLVTTNS